MLATCITTFSNATWVQLIARMLKFVVKRHQDQESDHNGLIITSGANFLSAFPEAINTFLYINFLKNHGSFGPIYQPGGAL